MTNSELIEKLRRCIPHCWDGCSQKCELFNAQNCHEALARAAADALEAAEKRIAELERNFSDVCNANGSLACERNELLNDVRKLEAQLPKWTMLKDEMPKPHTNVLVSGIEAINNSRVYKVMVNDNGTLRPTDYAPSIRWDYWMPFESPNCGARMKGEQE